MAGIAVVNLLAVVIIVTVCFVAGSFAQTRLGRALGDRLERAVLGRMPEFTLLKSMTRDMVGLGMVPKPPRRWPGSKRPRHPVL